MKVKLVGALPVAVRDLGFKAGEIYNAEPAQVSKYGAVRIKKATAEGEEMYATIYQENYKRI